MPQPAQSILLFFVSDIQSLLAKPIPDVFSKFRNDH
ncbi:hypothetical protein EMEDMD4_100090 [Sinorhizobium medicae]|uniref:Uncharacterized protein n=1 Tax=Sinorhizobium medicae TaxID=110321 RepID=A0A508WPD8_9HYPH|nr:hypothetical protein EMEDMD4_100090 [Sinorhizobium medicae]